MPIPRTAMRLRYGTGDVLVPGNAVPRADQIVPRPVADVPSEENLLLTRLARPVGSLPLREILKPGETVAVAVSDVTRYSATEKFLAPLLREADVAGVARKNVTVFVARGTHRALTAAELREVVGPEIDSGIRVAQSDPEGDTVDLGTTSRGTPVRVDRNLMGHDRIVLTGTISFHYFAGFGGGRKALVPGCAARETAHATHFRIFRDDAPGKHPMARAGVLAGNPVHEDTVEAVEMANPAFLLNTLLTPGRALFDAVAGHWRKAHEEGCLRYANVFRVRIPRRYPLVVASAGGYPKDINFIQSHKALDNAFRATVPGGALILLAECRDGFGHPTFLPWFRYTEPDEMERELRANYQIYGQTAHATLAKSKACRVILVSSLPPEDVERMGMTPAASLTDALGVVRRLLGEFPPALVIPDAGYVLPEAES